VHTSPDEVCNQRVLWQPEMFTEAYWQMSYVKVFSEVGTRTTCTDGSAFSPFFEPLFYCRVTFVSE
jgi:hypothetical protein